MLDVQRRLLGLFRLLRLLRLLVLLPLQLLMVRRRGRKRLLENLMLVCWLRQWLPLRKLLRVGLMHWLNLHRLVLRLCVDGLWWTGLGRKLVWHEVHWLQRLHWFNRVPWLVGIRLVMFWCRCSRERSS